MTDDYSRMHRRNFLRAAALGLAAAAVPGVPILHARERRLKRALKYTMVKGDLSVMEKFALVKRLGYDGIELESPNDLDAREVLAARDRTALPIHGVVDSVHWRKTLSDPDPAVRAEGVEALRIALSDAKTYGATTVLLVPAVVRADVPYDEAYRRSQEEIRKVLPFAERQGVRIALENVWNHFLLSPLEAARYVDELASPWLGWYFDIGNVVNTGWPEHWIHVLGPRIMKLDVKEYSREKRDREGPYAGFRVNLGEGDVDWPAVMGALAAIGFTGWATAEMEGGDETRLKEIAEGMQRVLA